MAAFVLPVSSALPHFKFQCDLDGATYGLEFEWNERTEAWFMSLYDVEDNPLVSGVRVVVGFPLANRSTNVGLPPGALLAVDTSGADLDPGLGDFGTRVQLLYYSVAEDGE